MVLSTQSHYSNNCFFFSLHYQFPPFYWIFPISIQTCHCFSHLKMFPAEALWLTPVIQGLWEAKVSGSPEVRSLRPAWSTRWNPISTKNTKISWAWWHTLVIPATQEAEKGESLEPGRQRLQWAEITSLHSSLGNSETPSQRKTKTNPNRQYYVVSNS